MKKIIIKYVSICVLLSTVLFAEVPTRDKVAELYVSTFNRAPDSAGLDYWVNDSMLTLEQIAQSFFDQPETKSKYPADISNHSFVQTVYRNLFNRDPDEEGWKYWENELDEEVFGRSVFILAVMNGAKNTEEFGPDATILENKKEVGLAYVNAGLNNTVWAKEVMNDVGATESSIEKSKEMVKYFVNVTPSPDVRNYCKKIAEKLYDNQNAVLSKAIGISRLFVLEPEDKKIEECQLALGRVYLYGYKDIINRDTLAFSHLNHAIMLGSEDAAIDIALMYLSGFGIKKDTAQAFNILSSLGTQTARSMNNLATLYLKGIGTEQNIRKALELYQQSVNNGNALAMFNLGRIYYEGKYIAKNITEGLALIYDAANLEEPLAYDYLGFLFTKGGEGVDIDYVEAVKFLEKAAEKGLKDAQNNLGFLYEKGLGIEQNSEKAFLLYQQAASDGNVVALKNLARCYAEGIGITKDNTKVIELYRNTALYLNSFAITELDTESVLVEPEVVYLHK